MHRYKPDWEQAAQRMEAWWEREIIDRPCLQIDVPKDPAAIGLSPDWVNILRSGRAEEQGSQNFKLWLLTRLPIPALLDPAEAIRAHRQKLELAHFLGESFPRFRHYLGPGLLTAFLGCPVSGITDETSWQNPILTNWDQVDNIKWDERNPWWQLTLRLTEAAVADSRGDYAVMVTDLGGPGDMSATLRGSQVLLTDLVDHPDEVAALEDRLTDLWIEVYNRLYAIIAPLGLGSCGWLRAWHHGRTYPVQCDISTMVSPKMFERFFLPPLLRQARALDRCAYHLDGPDEIRHLPLLLACPEIHAIQWVPGAGAPPMVEWIPLLQRIQAGKKALHINAAPWHVPKLLEELEPEGLMIETWAPTLEEAQGLLELAEKTAAQKARRWRGR